MRCTVAARGVESGMLPLLTDSYDHFYDTQRHGPTDRGKCSNGMMACYHFSALEIPLVTANYFDVTKGETAQV